MVTLFAKNLQEHLDLFASLDELNPVIEQAANIAIASLASGQKLLLCGNGGSAADCQHLAAELVGRLQGERQPLAALALTTDSSILTSIGNDYSFAEIFSRQVRGLGRSGDCLVAISTSGHSENVIRAVNSARELGMHTLGLLGCDGGALLDICDVGIVVPSNSTARIQEAHILIGHTLCGLIELGLGHHSI